MFFYIVRLWNFFFMYFMFMMAKPLKIVSYNCRSIKSSIQTVKDLCDTHDICLLQEHWLYKHELGYIRNVHKDFTGYGISSVNTEDGLICGRPHGGLAFMYKKIISFSV